MFLHSGASLHGHEYSSIRSPTSPLQPAKRKSLLKTALRPLSTPPDPSEAEHIVTYRRPELYNSRRASNNEIQHRPSLVVQRAASCNLSKKDVAVRFREPGMDQVHSPSESEDEDSIAGSELTDGTTDTSTRRKKHRRMPRKSTRYALAQPAPQIRTKQRHLVQIRPRLLLQLQEIGDRRAIPAFDLIPSHIVAGTLIIPKLAKRFPRIFHANAELCQNDVLLVRSDDYGSTPTRLSELLSDDRHVAHHDKEVCAVISALPKDCAGLAELVMEDGSSWVASAMANGSYEFTRADQGGETTTARWARRSNMPTRNSLGPLEPSSASKTSWQDSLQDSRWTFSIIDPSCRRHPIMGSLTAETLEVYDTYTTLSTSSGRFPPSRSFGPEAGIHHNTPGGFTPESRQTVQVRHEQKALMMATASWIRLHQQGWPESSNPKFAKAVPHHRRTVSGDTRRAVRRQTFPSYDEDGSHATSRPNSPDSMHKPPLSKHRLQDGVPARALSTGRAFMKRRSDRMQGLATVYSQGVPLSTCEPKRLGIKSLEKTGCLSRMRQWTNRLFHKRTELPS